MCFIKSDSNIKNGCDKFECKYDYICSDSRMSCMVCGRDEDCQNCVYTDSEPCPKVEESNDQLQEGFYENLKLSYLAIVSNKFDTETTIEMYETLEYVNVNKCKKKLMKLK